MHQMFPELHQIFFEMHKNISKNNAQNIPRIH